MGIIDNLKEKHRVHKEEKDAQRRERDLEERLHESHSSQQGAGDTRGDDDFENLNAGEGVGIESFGGGPRFDVTGPGPQLHDTPEDQAQPRAPTGGLTEYGRMEGGINTAPSDSTTASKA